MIHAIIAKFFDHWKSRFPEDRKSGSGYGIVRCTPRSMSDKEQAEKFGEELDNLVDRFRDEWDLSYAVVIGLLTVKAQALCAECSESDED